MYWRIHLGRASLATLAVGFCLATARAGFFDSKPRPPVVKGDTSDLSVPQLQRASAIAHYATGVSFELRGDTDAALAEYSQAFELDPHNTTLATRLTQFHVSRKDYTNALDVLAIALKAEPNTADLWFWQGLVYRTSEQIPKAIPAFQHALKLEPTHLNSVQSLLDIDLQQGHTNAAVEVLDRARAQSSTNWSYWMRLGDIHAVAVKQKPTLAGKLDGKHIRRCYEEARQLAPLEPDILLRLADIYADTKEYSKAADIYSKLLELRPNAPRFRERLADALIRAEQREKAITILQEIIKREPLRHEIYNLVAELYEDLQKDDPAISNYRQSLVINPNQLPPYLRIALLQMKGKHFADALKTLADAKDRFPTSFQVPYFTGLAYSDMKTYDKAVAAFADAQSLADTAPADAKLDASFYFYYGAACERSGNIDKAVTLFKRAIELDPEKHSALNYLGYMWAERGIHLDEALDLIKKAVAKDPDNGAYLDSLGWVLFKLGRTDEAIKQLRRAVELEKEDATVLDHLADVLLKIGKRDEAIATYQRAIKLAPDNKEIADKLKKLTK